MLTTAGYGLAFCSSKQSAELAVGVRIEQMAQNSKLQSDPVELPPERHGGFDSAERLLARLLAQR